jgi:bifunctional non-homologous end joining protein LigD
MFQSGLKLHLGRVATGDKWCVPAPKSEGAHHTEVTVSDMKRCHWVKPSLVCQVKFVEWTQDGKLRQPALLGLREDKNARAVIRETPA